MGIHPELSPGNDGARRCWLCDRDVDAFLDYGLPPRPGRCPHCGGKPRYRATAWFLRHVVRPRLAAGAEILEVGAGKTAVTRYPHETIVGPARYTVIDVRRLAYHDRLRPPHRFVEMDVTRADLDDASFDAVLIVNALPYIRDDRAALATVRRCLKPDGLALVDTHWRPGPTMTVADYRRAHPGVDDAFFHENGDQWVYGEDLPQRIAGAGLELRTARPFAGHDRAWHERHGLKYPTEMMVALRSAAGASRFGFTADA